MSGLKLLLCQVKMDRVTQRPEGLMWVVSGCDTVDKAQTLQENVETHVDGEWWANMEQVFHVD